MSLDLFDPAELELARRILSGPVTRGSNGRTVMDEVAAMRAMRRTLGKHPVPTPTTSPIAPPPMVARSDPAPAGHFQSEHADVIHMSQSARFWKLRVGHVLGYTSFEAYRKSIPGIPRHLLADDSKFSILSLVEPRVGLQHLCGLGGITFDGDTGTFVEYDAYCPVFAEPTWTRIQDGRQNQNRSVHDCRKTFSKSEIWLTAIQGVCAYLHHPSVVSEWTQADAHAMVLPGSVHRGNRDYAAYLKLWKGRPRLSWGWDGDANPEYGSASRREC